MDEFYSIKLMPIEFNAFYSIKRPILLEKLKKRTIKKVPGGIFGISVNQMKAV